MKKIKFKEKFDCVILLDGEFNEWEMFDNLGDVPVLAADGAAINLMKNKIEFEKVIGDLDTLKESVYYSQVSEYKLFFDPDQNSNDFEKVINYAIRRNYKDVMIFGIHGGQMEHTLNNWSVLKKYSQELNFCIYENGRYGIPVNCPITVDLDINEIVSLIPQPKVRLSTKGFVWELSNDTLELGVREGARNSTLTKRVTIDIHNGSILLFVDSRLPKFAKII